MSTLRNKFNLSAAAKRSLLTAAFIGATVLGAIGIYKGCEQSYTSSGHSEAYASQQCTTAAMVFVRVMADIGVALLQNSGTDAQQPQSSSPPPAQKIHKEKATPHTTVTAPSSTSGKTTIPPKPVTVTPQPAPVQQPQEDYLKKYKDLNNGPIRPHTGGNTAAATPATRPSTPVPSPDTQDYKRKYIEMQRHQQGATATP